jgi:hypothetical protein
MDKSSNDKTIDTLQRKLDDLNTVEGSSENKDANTSTSVSSLKSKLCSRPFMYYALAPILIIVLFLFTQPTCIMKEVIVTTNGKQETVKRICYTKLCQYSSVVSILAIGSIYYYITYYSINTDSTDCDNSSCSLN